MSQELAQEQSITEQLKEEPTEGETPEDADTAELVEPGKGEPEAEG